MSVPREWIKVGNQFKWVSKSRVFMGQEIRDFMGQEIQEITEVDDMTITCKINSSTIYPHMVGEQDRWFIRNVVEDDDFSIHLEIEGFEL